jgi:hypothetical protein
MASIKESFDRILKPLSTPALQLLHAEIRRLLQEEDERGDGAGARYGVRKHPDFRLEADAIERILTNRNESFEPIAW